jgi:threonine/homoserine/homoserine lactone efflux protein
MHIKLWLALKNTTILKQEPGMNLLAPQLLLSLSLFAFVTSVTPGPNNMMLLASGVNFGFAASIRHIVGISSGFLLMLLAVGLGLGQVFVAYPIAHELMKWAGALYMVYLAWCIAQSGQPKSSGAPGANRGPMGFWSAAAFQWINPKAWVMAVGYFSTYVPAGGDLAYVALASLLFAGVNLPSCGSWALMGQHLRRFLANDFHRKVFNRVMAGLLLASIIPAFLVPGAP